jgi:DNA-binding winged helix-turn-helix (wHTH) protein
MKVAFSGLMLDAEARRLTRRGHDVHLSPKAFDLLALLIDARPAVVEKPVIRARLWPNVHVVDASLTNLVTEIRGALGRDLGTHLVRTVHGVGYAFGGEIEDEPAAVVRDARCWLVYRDRPIALADGENVIGREPGATVWLDADSVSRRHAVVRVPGGAGAVTIEDLGSTNGTSVGGRRVAGVVELSDGDRVRVGQVGLVFRAGSADAKTKRVRRGR